MAWQIKCKPGDFVVREVIEDEVQSRWKEKIRRIHGKKAGEPESGFLWFTMKKTDRDFFESVDSIASELGISSKKIGYSGTKDRRAVTCQTLSVEGMTEGEIKNLKISGLGFSDFRQRNRPVKLGEHRGNDFTINVRNVGKGEPDAISRRLESIKRQGMINFFGGQRFGSKGSNHVAGRYLVMGDLENAAKTIMSGSGVGGRGHEHLLARHLERKPGDYEGALRRLPLRLLKLLVHAYQAHLWNAAAEEHMKSSGKQALIPIPGYGTILEKYPGTGRIIGSLLKSEGILLSSFRIRKIPELSSKGSEREFLCFPKDLSWHFGMDEINPDRMKLVLTFFLGKGSYATELVRQAAGEQKAVISKI